MSDANQIVFAVDPEAAFEAVTHDQIGGPFQVPAELVRMAIASGARSVDVRCDRSKVVVAAPEARLPDEAVEAFFTSMSRADEVTRLRALARLEDLGAPALAWAVGLAPRRLTIRVRTGDRVCVLSAGEGREPRLSRVAAVRGDGLSIELRGARLPAGRATRWLGLACRFSPVEVVVNGSAVGRPIDSGCFRARIHSPLPAEVAIGVDLDAPRLWLLRHGVVASRVGVPGWPSFEAAVEVGSLLTGRVSSSAMREAVKPHLEALIDRVVDLTLRVVPRLSEVPRERRGAVVRSLLKAVDRGVAVEGVRRADMFELIEPDGTRWVSLVDLDNWPARLPHVIGPRDADGRAGGPLLVMGERERASVADLIGCHLTAAGSAERGIRTALRRVIRAGRDRLAEFLAPKGLSEGDLTGDERRLVEVLRSTLQMENRPVMVVIRPGSAAPERRGGRLILGRDHEDTMRAAAALAEGRSWVRPVALIFKHREWDVVEIPDSGV